MADVRRTCNVADQEDFTGREFGRQGTIRLPVRQIILIANVDPLRPKPIDRFASLESEVREKR